MYPVFAPGTARYAVRTTDQTAGSLDVAATTSDLSGKVFVNVQNVLIFKVARVRHVVITAKQLGLFCAEQRGDFCARPNEKLAFFACAVSVVR